MSSPRIDSFLFDDENEDKITGHGLSLHRILQVLDRPHIIVPNRKQRRGLYLIIGRDSGGSCISIPIESTHTPYIWRPITAWQCKKGEETLLTKTEG
jgi:uncharacterized DUF497 family protein